MKYNVKFLVNDDPLLSKKLNADGCHLGQKDMNINRCKKNNWKQNYRNYLSQLNKFSKSSY